LILIVLRIGIGVVLKTKLGMSYMEERAILNVKTVLLRDQRKRSPAKGIKGLGKGS